MRRYLKIKKLKLVIANIATFSSIQTFQANLIFSYGSNSFIKKIHIILKSCSQQFAKNCCILKFCSINIFLNFIRTMCTFIIGICFQRRIIGSWVSICVDGFQRNPSLPQYQQQVQKYLKKQQQKEKNRKHFILSTKYSTHQSQPTEKQNHKNDRKQKMKRYHSETNSLKLQQNQNSTDNLTHQLFAYLCNTFTQQNNSKKKVYKGHEDILKKNKKRSSIKKNVRTEQDRQETFNSVFFHEDKEKEKSLSGQNFGTKEKMRERSREKMKERSSKKDEEEQLMESVSRHKREQKLTKSDFHDLYEQTFQACDGLRYIFYNFEKHRRGMKEREKYNSFIRQKANSNQRNLLGNIQFEGSSCQRELMKKLEMFYQTKGTVANNCTCKAFNSDSQNSGFKTFGPQTCKQSIVRNGLLNNSINTECSKSSSSSYWAGLKQKQNEIKFQVGSQKNSEKRTKIKKLTYDIDLMKKIVHQPHCKVNTRRAFQKIGRCNNPNHLHCLDQDNIDENVHHCYEFYPVGEKQGVNKKNQEGEKRIIRRVKTKNTFKLMRK